MSIFCRQRPVSFSFLSGQIYVTSDYGIPRVNAEILKISDTRYGNFAFRSRF